MFDKFDAATLITIQNLVLPLVATFTGFDVSLFVAKNSEMFKLVGEGLGDISALLMLVGSALEDGKLSLDEIETIVADAKDIPAALSALVNFFDQPEVE